MAEEADALRPKKPPHVPQLRCAATRWNRQLPLNYWPDGPVSMQNAVEVRYPLTDTDANPVGRQPRIRYNHTSLLR
jgi:hypothetical protein